MHKRESQKTTPLSRGGFCLKTFSNAYGQLPAQAAAEHVLPLDESYFQAGTATYFFDCTVPQTITEVQVVPLTHPAGAATTVGAE